VIPLKIAIAGGTGFIGKNLTRYFLNKGHEVFILTRSEKHSSEKNLHFVEWLSDSASPANSLEGVDAVINLAGKSINARWTEGAKKEIVESRIKSTKAIYALINELKNKPSVFINASAVGIYGTSLVNTFTEESQLEGNDFLANTVKLWEKESAKVADLHIRTVLARFGLVLGKAGALPKMIIPYKLFAGGKLGSGQQWVSWVHIDDVVRLIDHLIQTSVITGPVNVTAPIPVKMNEFGKTIGDILHRPHWIPAPSFAIKTLLGEMSILLLEGQKVVPEKALHHHFQFSYPSLDKALLNLLRST
jgi:uncharacterized protein